RGGVRLRRAAGRHARRRRHRHRRRGAVRRLVRAAEPARLGGRDRVGRRRVAAARARASGRTECRPARLLPRAAHAAPAGDGGGVPRRGARALEVGRGTTGRRRRAAARRGRASARAGRVAAQRRQGRARSVRALVTGGRGGLGRAFAAALGDAEVTALDLPEFDVGDPAAWRALDGEFEAAFLNAGVTTGEADLAALSDEQYRRALGANVDGVVFGI